MLLRYNEVRLYLGAHLTNNLSWKPHIQYVTTRANCMLGYLKRNFSLAPISLKWILYKILIRPKLEYAASIWDPGHDTLTTALESIQNRSARFILSNYHRTASVTSMKNSLCLPLLSLRRKISRLCLFHKMYFHNPLLRNRMITPPFYISSRLDHQHKVGVPSSFTTTFQSSFLPRTAEEWNHLPGLIATITDTNLFRNSITSYFSSDP